MEGMRNVYTILTGNFKGRGHFGDVIVDRRVVLMLKERDARVWIGFI
jgi:hypothetical protein